MDFRQNRELILTYFDPVFMLITRLRDGPNCGKSSLMDLDQAVTADCGPVKSEPQKARKRDLPPSSGPSTAAIVLCLFMLPGLLLCLDTLFGQIVVIHDAVIRGNGIGCVTLAQSPLLLTLFSSMF